MYSGKALHVTYYNGFCICTIFFSELNISIRGVKILNPGFEDISAGTSMSLCINISRRKRGNVKFVHLFNPMFIIK